MFVWIKVKCTMIKDLDELKNHFVWRRAFRSSERSVVRADVIEAFGMSPTSASNLLTSVAENSNGLLKRNGNKVISESWARPPAWADENDLMDALDRNKNDFSQTGLRSNELPVNYSAWSLSLPAEPGALTTVVQAITRKHSVYVEYVGLKMGDKAKFRRVYPLGLERMGDQWRLVAHDLEHGDFALRTFVLSRITKASVDSNKLPRTFIPGNAVDSQKLIDIEWNLLLNEDQKKALRNEFGVNSQGVVKLNGRDVHEFLVRFGARKVSENVAWPLLRREKKTD